MAEKVIHIVKASQSADIMELSQVYCGTSGVILPEHKTTHINEATCDRCKRIVLDISRPKESVTSNIVLSEEFRIKEGVNIGYRRVSTIDQSTARQLLEIDLDRVFEDKISGKSTERPALQECIAFLRPHDTLHVHSIDRLARNLMDLQNIIKDLTEKGVSIKFHKENLVFSGQDSPMQKLQLHLMGAFAEFERSLIKERQKEGIAIAKKNGVRFGRPSKMTEEETEEASRRILKGENPKDIAPDFGVSKQTIYQIKYKLRKDGFDC